MYEKILIALCSKDEVDPVLRACMRLLGTSPSEVHLLAVEAAPRPKVVGDYMNSALLVSESEANLAREHVTATAIAVKEVFEANDLSVREHATLGKPHLAVVDLAEKLEVNFVILSKGLWRSSISSIWHDFRSASLLRRINCSFLVVGPEHPRQSNVQTLNEAVY
jgi:nucleotide-binding universal stress UspA family protein